MKKLLSVLMLAMTCLLLVPTSLALDNSNLEVFEIEINGKDFDVDDLNGADNDDIILSVEEGEELDISVGLKAGTGGDEVEVDAKIGGVDDDEHDGKLYDSTDEEDYHPGVSKYADLQLLLPTHLEKKEYTLRIRAMQSNGDEIEYNFQLFIEPAHEAVRIAAVHFSPGNTVKAGRSLLTTVLLENYGEDDMEDVEVTVSIPALGVSAAEYVDEVDNGASRIEYEDVPEMFLPIPATAEAGQYEVVVTVRYDNLFKTVTEKFLINVVENEMFQTSDKLVLAVGPASQTVAAGSSAVYGVALTNEGAKSKAYALQVTTGDWASATVSEGLVVLSPGQSKVVDVTVTPAANAPAGAHAVSLAVSANNQQLETVSLSANVVPAQETSSTSLRNGLEIALIVLVVLLVIIGLIIGFSRLRKDDEDEEQTYY